MKLITLNIWGGCIREALLAFIAAHQDVDIFCLQEVYHKAHKKISPEERVIILNILSEIQALLPHHEAFFRPTVNNTYGIATLVKSNIDVLGEGEVYIHHNPEYTVGPAHSRNLQWLECRVGKKMYAILNIHGLWNGQGKTDTPARIAQSQRVRTFMDTLNVPKILCGDFNLRPDTESLKILEEGMINLIKTHQVQSTRTRFYPKAEKFADYILTSSDIEVQKFAVMPEEVSDHAALFLEFT